MRKFHTKILLLILMLAALKGNAQQPSTASTTVYSLLVRGVDKDSVWIVSNTGLQTKFT